MSTRPSPRQPTSRRHSLDALRGFAALAVMLSHYPLTLFGQRWFPTADLAVDLFYCLSGVVLWMHFGPKLSQGMGLRQLMAERLIRVYPLYFIGLVLGLVATALAVHQPGGHIDLGNAFWRGLLLWPVAQHSDVNLGGHLLHDEVFPLNPPCWSLFFELLAGASLVLWRRLPGWKAMVLPLLLLLAVWAKWSSFTATAMASGWSVDTVHMGAPRALFSFGMGVMLCRCWQAGDTPHWMRRGLAPSTAIVAMGLLMWTPYSWFRMSSHLVVPATALLIPLLVGLVMQRSALRSPTLQWLGQISYPIYVLHTPLYLLIEFIAQQAGQHAGSPWITCLSVAGTLLAAHLVQHHVDAPVRRWLKLARRRPQASHAEPATTANAAVARTVRRPVR